MCGIVGYVGARAPLGVVLDGLERLQSRSYDSAGISVHRPGALERVRTVGSLAALRDAVAGRIEPCARTAAIGHLRSATQGPVSVEDAHPHADPRGRVHVVLNGIVENHVALRRRLVAAGAVFESSSDAEVVAHLVAAHDAGDLAAAVRAVCAQLHGLFSFVAVSVRDPELLVAARRGCPLVVGVAEGERFIASSIAAFAPYTRAVQLVENEDVVTLRAGLSCVIGPDGRPRERAPIVLDVKEEAASRGGFGTHMLREIHDEPTAVADTLAGRLRDAGARLPELGLTAWRLRRIERVAIVASGSSYHAGLLGRWAIQSWAGVPVDVELASEYRYAEPVGPAPDLVLAISASGETADTLGAVQVARERGIRAVGITDMLGSRLTREADAVLATRAGLEIGVGATKTFAAQVAVLELLALVLAEARGASRPRLSLLASDLQRLPAALGGTLAGAEPVMRVLAERLAGAAFLLYVGRGPGLPVALEGALKLRGVARTPAEAAAAGELKHGPIALVGPGTPVVCVATASPLGGTLLATLSEVRARGGRVIALGSRGSKEVAEHAEEVVYVPGARDPVAAALAAVVPLQLLAHDVAHHKHLDVDRPHHIARTVTVE